ncbi:MAG TPA: hypothetical protein VJW20_02215 [Candidatus Angelobacter sp.]|nr:hypothetical protein [Candidatus Angelobacter sp.]
MDPIKLIIFCAAFLLLLLLGRKLSGSGDAHELTMPPQDPMPSVGSPPPAILPYEDEDSEPSPDAPRVVGADLPFPITLPEIKCDADGRYNRPEFLNYYFEKTDLKTGPADPASFYDDFYMMTRDAGSNQESEYRYLVATPTGLQSVMASEHRPALYIEGQTIIVPRWDLTLILDTVVKQIMKDYAEPGDPAALAAAE